MKDISISEVIHMQEELWEKHKENWKPMLPQYGRNYILWMIEEVGECISIIKKKGDNAIIYNPTVRAAFIEEMSDILMYYAEVMRRYNITPTELSETLTKKHKKNLTRDFLTEYETLYEDE